METKDKTKKGKQKVSMGNSKDCGAPQGILCTWEVLNYMDKGKKQNMSLHGCTK